MLKVVGSSFKLEKSRIGIKNGKNRLEKMSQTRNRVVSVDTRYIDYYYLYTSILLGDNHELKYIIILIDTPRTTVVIHEYHRLHYNIYLNILHR